MTPAEQIESFFAKRPLKKYTKGEVVVFPNDTVPPISLLIKGQVGQYHITDDGIKMLLTIFKPGAYFPMSAAINATPSPHFFEALTPVEVRQAPSRDVAEFVKDKPDILFDLLGRLYRGIDGLL